MQATAEQSATDSDMRPQSVGIGGEIAALQYGRHNQSQRPQFRLLLRVNSCDFDKGTCVSAGLPGNYGQSFPAWTSCNCWKPSFFV
jgi:hypothetical protein